MSLENIEMERKFGEGYEIRGELIIDHDLVMDLWVKYMNDEKIRLKVKFMMTDEMVMKYASRV